MALDVYAGSLTRFYTLDWENAAQTSSDGHVYRQGSPEAPVDKSSIPPAGEVEPAVIAWRDAVSQGLATNISSPLDWEEGVHLPYATDRPGQEGYAGLMLWAAYANHPDKEVPKSLPTAGCQDDPVLSKAMERESKTPVRAVLQPQMWFPCEFPFIFQVPAPSQEPTWIGSSLELKRQLDKLNEITFKATQEDMERWLAGDIKADSEVEHAAKFTFASLLRLASFSIENRVPMLVAGQ